MAGKEISNAVHRPRRGRTLPEAKGKTDSGCFVDEEIEKLSTGTATASSSSHTLSVKKHTGGAKPGGISEGSNCLADVNQNLNVLELDTESVSSSSYVPPLDNNHVNINNKGRAMSDESTATPEQTTPDSSASSTNDFYCLFYNDSPEATLATNEESQHNSAPLFRSHDNPTLSAIEERVEEISNCCSTGAVTKALGQTREESLVTNAWGTAINNRVTPGIPEDGRELSSSEGKHFHTEVCIAVNSSGHVPLAYTDDDYLSSSDDDDDYDDDYDDHDDDDEMHTEVNLLEVESKMEDHQHSSKGMHADSEMIINVVSAGHQQHSTLSQKSDMQHIVETRINQTELSVDPLCFADEPSANSVVSASNIPDETCNTEYQDHTATAKRKHTILDDTDGAHVSSNIQYQAEGKERSSSVLSRVREIEEVSDHVVTEPRKKRPVSVAGYPLGQLPADMHTLKHRSWPVSDATGELDEPQTGLLVSTRQEGHTVMSKVQGFEEMVADASRLQPAVQRSGGIAGLLHVDRTFVHETKEPEGSSDRTVRENTILPSRIMEEVQEDLLIELALQHKTHKRGRRSGSFAECSNLSDLQRPNSNTAWKRRSWSVCDETTRNLAFPFMHEVRYPGARRTTSQQFRDSSPYVHSIQNTEAVHRRRTTPSKVTPERSQSFSGFHPIQQSRGNPQYWSDNSSVGSESEFPQQLSRRWKKGSRIAECSSSSYDNSSSADYSGAENERSFSSSTPMRQFGCSLNNKNPFSAVQQELSECSDSDSEARNSDSFDPIFNPRLRALRKLSSTTCSSSSDSEVERYFKEPLKAGGQDGLTRKPRRKTSAMEALYGGNSSTAFTPVDDDLLQGFGAREQALALSERFTVCEEADDTLLPKNENKTSDSEPLELEFDDTDYSEFYTRCEDKQSILKAEALNVKEMLGKMAVIEDQQAASGDADAPQGTFSDESESSSDGTDCSTEPCSVASQTEVDDDMQVESEFTSRQCNRGTQTPPPYPSARTGMSTRDRGVQTPPPPTARSKAISAEELLDILSSLSTGNLSSPALRKPTRKSLSVQKYDQRQDYLAPESRSSSTGSISTGSQKRWRHSSEHQRRRRNDMNRYSVESQKPTLYSQSYDCIRRDLFGNQEETIRTQKVASKSVQDELQKYKPAKIRPALFEEEIDCAKANGKGSMTTRSHEEMQAAQRLVNISFVGSEPTEMIEAEVKLTGPVHSLKRKRAGRAIVEESQQEEKAIVASTQITNTTTNEHPKEDAEEGHSSSDSTDTSDQEDTEEDSKGNDTHNSGVNVFIDYRKKDVMHVVCNMSNSEEELPEKEHPGCTSPEPGAPEEQSSPTLGIKRAWPNGYKKDLYSITEERSSCFDAESIGGASSSSQSSEDDAFGSFSGSNETVVFVDTSAEKVPDTSLLDSVLGIGIGNGLKEGKGEEELTNVFGDLGQGMCDLDVILGRVRKSVDFEVFDTNVLDQAIERFKQRVPPNSQDKVTGGMTMEAFVALNQADELQGIINGIKGELKLLQDENIMLREQVVHLAHGHTVETRTTGETTKNSSTESSPVNMLDRAPKLSSSTQTSEHTDKSTEQGQDLRLVAVIEHSPVKQSESGHDVNRSRDAGPVERSTVVYRSSKKNEEMGDHSNKSRSKGTVKDAVHMQGQTDMQVNTHRRHSPLEDSAVLHKSLPAGQGQTDRHADKRRVPGPVKKLNGVCEQSSVKHSQTGLEQEVDLAGDGDLIEIDVCLRGFTMMPGVPIPLKKADVRLGTVAIRTAGEDLGGVIGAAKKMFVDHIKQIDTERSLGLGPHSIQGVQAGVVVWTPGSLKKHQSPRVVLSRRSNPCVIQLKDGNHFSCDTVVYHTLLPRELVENYALQLLEHRYLIFCGVQRLGKSYLASKLAEQVVQRIGWNKSPAVLTFKVGEMARKDLKQKLSALMECDLSSAPSGTPAVIILDQLNCLASLSDIFDVSQLEGNVNSPYIIGVRDKSKKGPFTSKDLNLHQYFRWIQVSVFDKQYSGILGRFLKRKLCWAGLHEGEERQQLLALFEWLSLVWKQINHILAGYCDQDSTLGSSLFYSCPMNFRAAEGWFANVWNYTIVPHLHQKLRMGKKIFDRNTVWEDPTRWVILRYPWDREKSKSLGTLRKLRQVDVVLNRNHTGEESVAGAECRDVDERIRRSHSMRSSGSRHVQLSTVPRRTGKTSSACSFLIRPGTSGETGV